MCSITIEIYMQLGTSLINDLTVTNKFLFKYNVDYLKE